MKKKRIFILAYTRQNLGDDLFIYILLKKYPNVQFYINIEKSEHAKLFQNFTNLTIYEEERRTLTKENAKDYDGYVYIAGSIFMEGIGSKYIITEPFLEFMKECKKNNIPFHYISSNFGPYYSEGYLELAKKVFQNCTSIYFRDTYSKKLFSEIETVHYAPDLIFSYLPEKVEKIPNTVGITIIDLSIRKGLCQYKDVYYTMLENNIREYIKQGKQITLFSFCKHEGDEKAIQEFISQISNKIAQPINIVNYDGNIEYFLREYAKMEYMICSRFHAMVLSVIMGQKCEIMSYSNKIDNVIEDLELFKQNIIHFNNIKADTKMPLENFEQVQENKVKQIAQNAKRQLEGLKKSVIR